MRFPVIVNGRATLASKQSGHSKDKAAATTSQAATVAGTQDTFEPVSSGYHSTSVTDFTG